MGGDDAQGTFRTESDQQNPQKEEKHQRKDFSVEIIFSSIPYSEFCIWKADRLVDKRKPNSSQGSVLDLAWSSPKGNYYGPSDETIFIDCSQNNLDKFKDVTDDKKLSLTAYMSYAINRLKSIIYRKTKDGGYGKVDVKIIAIHPCQKCLFALSALLGKKQDDKGVYKTYISNILKLDEYRYTFRWIQKKGWEFNVQYCAIFDAYRAVLEDKKGNDERIKELEKLKEKHKKGDTGIMYNGVSVDYDYIESEYERLTDPSVEQLRENVEAMKKQKEEVEKAAKGERYRINQALNEQNPYEMANFEVENLRNSSPKYKNKSKEEIKDLLQKRGLIDTQHIIVEDKNASGLLKAIGGATSEHQHAAVYLIDGVRQDVWTIENRKKEIQEEVDEANRNYEIAQKALKDKEMAYVNGWLDVVQFVVSVASIAFPPLAIIDISISVCRWVGGPDCTTQENIVNGVGLAMDIAGLIPYFGTMAKVSKGLSKAAEGQIMDMAVKNGLKPKITQVDKMRGKLSQIKPDEELELISIGSQDFNKMSKATQDRMLKNPMKSSPNQHGMFPDKNKNNVFVTARDSNGNIYTTEMTYDSAVETFGKAGDQLIDADGHVFHLHNNSTIKASDLDKALSNELKPVIQNNEAAIKKVHEDVIKGLYGELKKTATEKAGHSVASTGTSLWRSTLKEIDEFYNAQKAADVTVLSLIPTIWGIGYNGLFAILDFDEYNRGIKYNPKAMKENRKKANKKINEKPKWPSPKDAKQSQLDGMEEYNKATKDLEAAQKANNQEAIESAKRRQAAAESLATAQMEISVYGEKDTKKEIKQAQTNFDIAKKEEQNAKAMLDRQQSGTAQQNFSQLQSSNSSNPYVSSYISQAQSEAAYNYLYPDANKANYAQAQANTKAAEDALNEAKMNDYALMVARANAQMATEDIEYEKDVYSTKNSSSKKSDKKSKK